MKTVRPARSIAVAKDGGVLNIAAAVGAAAVASGALVGAAFALRACWGAACADGLLGWESEFDPDPVLKKEEARKSAEGGGAGRDGGSGGSSASAAVTPPTRPEPDPPLFNAPWEPRGDPCNSKDPFLLLFLALLLLRKLPVS